MSMPVTRDASIGDSLFAKVDQDRRSAESVQRPRTLSRQIRRLRALPLFPKSMASKMVSHLGDPRNARKRLRAKFAKSVTMVPESFDDGETQISTREERCDIEATNKTFELIRLGNGCLRIGLATAIFFRGASSSSESISSLGPGIGTSSST